MIAERLLGDIELTSEQLAGLRAINHAYFTRMYALLHPADAHHAAAPTLTDEQTATLRATVERQVLELLTPSQRAALDAR